MTATFVNMTPHDINLLTTEGEEITTFPSEGKIRLDKSSVTVGLFSIEGQTVELLRSSFVAPIGHLKPHPNGIPEPVEGTMFIVSALVANAYPERTDFVMVENTVRDDNGRIIGCTAFALTGDDAE
jgi:hypothetical protein